MHILAIRLKQNRDNYRDFVTLFNTLSKFQQSKNSEIEKELTIMTKLFKEDLILPSGRIGNPLAVALEMNMYDSALFMIKNAKELGIDLNRVSYSRNYKNIWNAKEVFEYSLTYFNDTKDNSIIDKDNVDLKLLHANTIINNNINSMLEIKSMYNLSLTRKKTKN